MSTPLPDVYGLLITKEDHTAFGDWCRNQLRFYRTVVCLDGSTGDSTAVQARAFGERLIYLHERDFEIPFKTDHGLRRIVHAELIRRFGPAIWIMCCHTDEFCYHDPRKIALLADSSGYDLVSWFSPHFYPHPSERAAMAARLRQPLQERFAYYHWNYRGSGLPWIEDRLYRAGSQVAWDNATHGSVRPHGLHRPAPFHPIYRHFKVCEIDLTAFELDGPATRYRGHWEGLEHRTGLPYRAEREDELFITEIPNYASCSRFTGRFDHGWNIGEQYRPDEDRSEESVLEPDRDTAIRPRPSVKATERPVLAFGPRIPEFGSWNWVGEDIAQALSQDFDVRIFDQEIPDCDLAVLVKFKPDLTTLRQAAQKRAVIFAPIDCYGSAAEIDEDALSLLSCDRVVLHCEKLRKYFAGYAPLTYMDHHLKFAAPLRTSFRSTGPLLWVGVRSNLPPLVEWVNARQLPEELWVLTNPEQPEQLRPADYGFRPHNRVRMACWSAERQREWTHGCRAALDVKGEDFRARHKPPSKGLDYVASGVPLALQPEGSTAEHLAALGLKVAGLDDVDSWLSYEYWEETARFGMQLRETLSLKQIAQRWSRVISEVLAERKAPTRRPAVTSRDSFRSALDVVSKTVSSGSRDSAVSVRRLLPVVEDHLPPQVQFPLNLPAGAVAVPMHVRGTVDRAIIGDLWERDAYGVLNLHQLRPRTVLDIGAHIGAFALLARRMWPEARVIACEADPENVRLLQANLGTETSVEIVSAAIVGEDVHEVTFHAVTDKGAANSGGGSCLRPELGSAPCRVPALSVAELWMSRQIEFCDLLKLDCEGCERPILRKLHDVGLLCRVGLIVGEWHASDGLPDTTARVRAEIEQSLRNTHLVEFSTRSTGREGHFRARRRS